MAIRGLLHRGCTWLIALVMCGALLWMEQSARADGAKPDPIGDFMTSPTDAAVPGYKAPADPAKPAPEELKPERLRADIDGVAKSSSRNFYAVNFTWTLVAGFLVMFMQAGFALVETGLCRAKNSAHTMSMNFMVYALGMTGFFLCGFAFMCGGANGTFVGGPASLGGVPTLDQMFKIGEWGIFGKTGFMLTGGAYDAQAIVWFLFMMVFMDTTATIPTGALAERWNFKSFFIFSLFIGGLTYPIYGGWVWGGGWLAQLGKLGGLGHGVLDYAGSSVVHLQGGALALVCCWLLGPRLGKYKDGKPQPILGHHIPMVILGTFILAFGWFGFNAGSSLAATDGRIGIIAVNTMLASAAGALAACLYMWIIQENKKPDPTMMCNGMLAGLVAITAPCAFVTPPIAFLIGLISGVLVVVSVFFWEKRGIDDPVGAISVHGVNGAWGVLCIGLFADGKYGIGLNGVDGPVLGLFYGGGVKQLLAQAIAVVVCVSWNMVVGGLIFWTIGKVIGSNRVSQETEYSGLDIPEMGIPGYPEFGSGSSIPEQFPTSAAMDSAGYKPSGVVARTSAAGV
ncbi:MAG TPA: ammonium transporter [Tepidisphaeraceae bacterium]|nr:ammonium transporter [Tepidisphaeraceae bacterium]